MNNPFSSIYPNPGQEFINEKFTISYNKDEEFPWEVLSFQGECFKSKRLEECLELFGISQGRVEELIQETSWMKEY